MSHPLLRALLSDDLPRSKLLVAVLAAVGLYLAAMPSLGLGARAMNVAITVCVFIVLVGSFDLLLGYAGMVSFAHAMFYGIGAYGVGIALHFMGPTWTALAVGVGGALLLSLLLAIVLALVALRVQAIFYAMTTLAVASAFGAVVVRFSELTGGDDGRSFQVPAALMPGLQDASLFGLSWQYSGRTLVYYLVLVACAALLLAMLRIVNSRFGCVLKAMRENEFRSLAIGYRTFYYRLTVSIVAALIATCAGVLMALWTRYVGPQTSVGFNVMLNILLMAVIGGLGTVYGAVLGAVVYVVAENYLQVALASLAQGIGHVPVLGPLLSPDRWMLWFGLSFILVVYFFPTGLVGKLRELAARVGP